MPKFRVTIEFANGNVSQHDVDEFVWFRYLFPALEIDDSVVHYTVDNL